MKQSVNVYEFRDAFMRIRPENFSYEGLELLFDYLEQYEEDCGEELELDVVALCCDYSEDTVEAIADNYDIKPDWTDDDDAPELDDEEKAESLRDTVLEYLNENTSVVGVTASGSIVYQTF